MNRLLVDAGRGLLAGAVGTAATTLWGRAGTALRRSGGDAISRAADRVEDAVAGEAAAAHPEAEAARWAYGTGFGAIAALLRAGMPAPAAAAAHLALVAGADELVLPAMGAVPAPRRDARSLLAGLARSAVYVAVVGGILALFGRRPD